MKDSKDTIWWRLINLNPTIWRGLVVAILAIAGTLGFDAATDLPDNVMLLIIGLIPVIQAVWTRGAVTPNAKVAVEVPDPSRAPNVIVAGEAVVPSTVSHELVVERAMTQGVR